MDATVGSAKSADAPRPRRPEVVAWAGYALVALGIALRARQYATDRSLWLDESYLVAAILDRPWTGLFAHLPYAQVAPVGFLAIEKVLVAALGPAEWVLRLLPFGAGCAVLPVVHALAGRAIGPVAALAPLAIVATSRAAVYFSSEFKQYSTDLFVSAGLVLLAARLRDRPARPGTLAALCLAGVLAPWFSHPSVFVLGAIGLTLAGAAAAQRDLAQMPRLGLLAATWIASFALLYATSLSRDVGSAVMQAYWGRQGCFAPSSPAGFPGWLAFVGRQAMIDPVGLPGRARLAEVLALAGAASLLARRRWWAGVLLLPLAFVVAAAGLHLYPCCNRLLLFAVPFLGILVGAGLAALFTLPTTPGRWAGAAVGLLAAGQLATRAAELSIHWARNPDVRQNLRPVMERVAGEWQPGDALVVTFPAAPATRYYARRFGIGPVLGDWDHVVEPPVGEPREFPPRGRKWIVFTGRGQKPQQEALLREIDRLGRRIQSIREDDSEAVLYDFDESPAGADAAP